MAPSPPGPSAAAPDAAATRDDMAGRSVRAAGWVAVSAIGNVVLSFVVFLVLARLLDPSEFGLVAVAVVFIDILLIVTRGGLPDLVVQTDRLDDGFVDTAFWVALASGCLYGLALVALSWPIAWMLRIPELQPVLAALAATFVIAAAGVIHEARLQRLFGFRSLAIRALVANLIGGSVAIALALNGFGVWSLVIQRLLATGMTTLLTWAAFPWLPGWRFVRAHARRQLAFGSRVFSTQLLLTLSIRSQEVVAAYFLSTADIGLLRMAWRCIDLISQVAVIPLAAVALPTYARLQDRPRDLAAAFDGFVAMSAVLALPAFVGMAVVAPHLVPLLFGEQWRDAVPVLRILALLGPEFVATSMLWMIFTASDRTGTALVLSAAQFTITILASLVTAPFGLSALVVGHVLRAYLFSPVVVRAAGRFVPVGTVAVAASLAPILACSLAMGATVFLAQDRLYARLGDHAGLAAAIGLGILIYGILALLFLRAPLRRSVALILNRKAALVAAAAPRAEAVPAAATP
ncbi:lipopolysaccharide biosynthesis protein [Methylobacterium sp. WL30]|nr:lipopolysaccharide biosynthesis protein [Methylobacterium sp. E-016]TXN34690.1 lipopolysaccharide biosynthesis protein [Methylobacterium sp. WL93]TXN51293.1 lipopolysaccharide biosynthesis protein [Methylobacterium sp. WL119]TXN64908.1 lipopolysaccharide biosynthesis protein [Methylobacterium sp. WL30]